jgi:hypothetical protein
MENTNVNIPSDPGKSTDKNHNLSTDNLKGNLDSFRLNREIAYKGHIGRLREEFCLNFIQKKQEFFKDLSIKQNAKSYKQLFIWSRSTIDNQKIC